MLEPSPASRKFAFEIIEIIIDALRHDPPSLANFSLTCSGLHVRSRIHIFRTIHIRGQERLDALTALLDHDSTICSLVRVVAISDENDARSGTSSFFNVAPVALAYKFPNLTGLQFNGHIAPIYRSAPGSHGPSFRREVHACLRQYASVKALHLKNVVASVHELAQMLVSLPVIQDLLCMNVRGGRRPSSGTWSRHPRFVGRLHLSTLRVRCAFIIAVGNFLIRPFSCIQWNMRSRRPFLT